MLTRLANVLVDRGFIWTPPPRHPIMVRSRLALGALHPIPDTKDMFTASQCLPAKGIMSITVAELTMSKSALNHP